MHKIYVLSSIYSYTFATMRVQVLHDGAPAPGSNHETEVYGILKHFIHRSATCATFVLRFFLIVVNFMQIFKDILYVQKVFCGANSFFLQFSAVHLYTWYRCYERTRFCTPLISHLKKPFFEEIKLEDLKVRMSVLEINTYFCC